MKIVNKFAACGVSGACPTVYQLESGDVVLQAYKIEDTDKTTFNLPPEEDVLLLPKAFIELYLSSLKNCQMKS